MLSTVDNTKAQWSNMLSMVDSTKTQWYNMLSTVDSTKTQQSLKKNVQADTLFVQYMAT